MKNVNNDPKDKITNADDSEIFTNSELKDLPEQLEGSDADYVADSPQKENNKEENEIEKDGPEEEIDPKDNPEK